VKRRLLGSQTTQRAAKAGRDIQTISVSVFGVALEQKLLDTYRAAGVTRAILRLPSEGRGAILPLLDQYAKCLP
jgi:hypothetical protein